MCAKLFLLQLKSCFICVILTSGLVVDAQPKIERQVFGSQGASNNNGTTSIEWTIGETAVSSNISAFVMLTEGFQQGFKYEEIPLVRESEDLSFNITPNPATSIVSVTCIHTQKEVFHWTLFDLNGKSLQSNISSHLSDFEIDISNYPDGIYIIKLSGQKSQQTNRIVKTTFF
jgi:Secretion system C-terminal sorting domain